MADAKPKKSAATKKIADVKRGGDAASGTSRQIIINNRPIIKDPMMAEVTELANAQAGIKPADEAPAEKAAKRTKIEPVVADDAAEPTPVTVETTGPDTSDSTVTPPAGAASAPEVPEPAETPPAGDTPANRKKVIEPLPAEPKTAEEAVEEPTAPEPAEPAVDAADQPVAAEDDNKEASAAPAETPSSPPEAATPDKPSGTDDNKEPKAEGVVEPGRSSFVDETGANTGDQPDEGQVDEKGNPKKAAAPTGGELTAEQQKAVDAEQYFLPITTAETRRMHRELALAILLIIVLLAAWLDIMLDAGFLKLGHLHALTNFF